MAGGQVRAAIVPEVEIAEIDGITVVLGALLAIRTGVVLYCYALENDRTRALDSIHAAEYEAWGSEWEAARARGETEPPSHPPPWPGTRVLTEDLRLQLRDDVRTEYAWAGDQSGGTGTAWQATWRFKPGIPGSARSATVLAHLTGGRVNERTLAL